MLNEAVKLSYGIIVPYVARRPDHFSAPRAQCRHRFFHALWCTRANRDIDTGVQQTTSDCKTDSTAAARNYCFLSFELGHVWMLSQIQPQGTTSFYRALY